MDMEDLYTDNPLEFPRLDPDDDTEYIGLPRLIAIIGDEDTCCGFVLGGIGQMDEKERPNYFIVDPKTDFQKVEKAFLGFLHRPDIGLILITKEAAEKISVVVKQYKGIDPAVMIIPGHNGPYEIDLPPAVKELEERRLSAGSAGSRRSSVTSATSIKQSQGHGALSRTSLNSTNSSKSLNKVFN